MKISKNKYFEASKQPLFTLALKRNEKHGSETKREENYGSEKKNTKAKRSEKFAERKEAKTAMTVMMTVRYHSGGSMKLNACILILAHMVY